MSSRTSLTATVVITSLFCAQVAQAETEAEDSEGSNRPSVQVAGPLDVAVILDENDREKDSLFVFEGVDNFLRPWLDFREGLNEEHGFRLGVDYQVLAQGASRSLGEDEASGHAFRVLFDWNVFARGTESPGSIVFKAENRTNLWTDVAPENLGAELGYEGITGTAFGDFGWGVTDLYWKQRFDTRHGMELRLGRIAPTAFFDVTLQSDPLTRFLNLSIAFTPTLGYPQDGSLGVAVGYGITDRVYVVGTVLDANSKTTRSGFETIGQKEFFSGLELGFANRGVYSQFVDNVHLHLWHSDARAEAGLPSDSGGGITASWLFGDDRWSPFVRVGWSEGNTTFVKRSVAAGAAFNLTERDDLIGVAGSWGKPSGAPDIDQYSFEFFYRLQLAKNLALTGDVQYLRNPANNPTQSEIWVFGARLRMTL